MSAKAIREFDGKHLLNFWIPQNNASATFMPPAHLVSVTFDLSIQESAGKKAFEDHVKAVLGLTERQHDWLKTTKLVCKPDQLIKRRGKNGLLGINLDWAGVKKWIAERAGSMITAAKLMVEVNKPFPTEKEIQAGLLKAVTSDKKRKVLVEFISNLYHVYSQLNFTYLEINPLVVLEEKSGITVHALDLAAKLDQTADFECGQLWSKGLKNAYPASTAVGGPTIEFPAPFGRKLTKEEAYIADLDAKTGASLKLTVLNPHGRIWTMVAGGGASVVYADAIAAYGYTSELANYGEYSGAPSESQTYEYAKTILDLMTRGAPHADGKYLFIGGGIANFTNVAATFKGIIRAMKEYQQLLQAHKVKVFVRRAGPNYQEGLRLMRTLGETLGVEINVFGPEMHVTGIVPLALKGDAKGLTPVTGASEANSLMDMSMPPQPSVAAKSASKSAKAGSPGKPRKSRAASATKKTPLYRPPFSKETRAFIYGMQPRAVQGMLDFDFMCQRSEPSVVCMIYPFGGHHVQKFYWGTKETLLPVYTSIEEACKKFPDVDVAINFASFRSVYESTRELMTFPQIKTIAIIAEGVPEKRARELLWEAKEKDVLIIGPATVGGITPGSFKIGNTGGMMDNIVASKLYRPGSVAYVSKSGGMSNELNNIISRATDGVYEGVAIGGDRYPGSTFIDHILRFEADDKAKMIVLLGEVGGVEEYEIAEAVKNGKITKPVVAWCIGTCATMFTTDVQFGHAGSFANSDRETARAKNASLRAAGVHVPDTFEDLPNVLTKVYDTLVQNGTLVPTAEPMVPKIPIDYAWAQELGLIRKPASFISTICDDRGQELFYSGMAISEIFKEDIGIGGVLSLLWFKRRLPSYATKFIEMVLMLTADHGPAVSGAHNTIVTARAGKDLISSLVSGLLTIGDRFGGALDGAAQMFSSAYDKGLTPGEFVSSMRKSHQLILGIGHKIKSRTNPDLRVSIVKEYVLSNFPNADTLKYAMEVEKITTAKKDNLILNVDGAVGVAFVDLLRGCGAFSREEAEEYIQIGTLNGLFVLGRSIGFIGHYLDQKRLKQGLYRHSWDDISYMLPSKEERDGFLGVGGEDGGRTLVKGDSSALQEKGV
ncbi:citrate synthase [Kappamyces sp. JEL0680]|nr:citrate synthase [Kappamyces sp. JEL0680]